MPESIITANRLTDGRALGIVALGDPLREDAVLAVAALRKAGLKTILVTGDNERAARRVAGDLGIHEVHAGVLPQDKAAIVRGLQTNGRVGSPGPFRPVSNDFIFGWLATESSEARPGF